MLVASRARLRTGSFAPRLGPLQAPGAPSRQGSVLALAVIDRLYARDGTIDLADPEATAPMLALCDTLGTRVPAFSQGRAE